MRTLIYHVAVTLDGCIADPDGSFAGFLAEGDHVADYLESLQSYDAVIMGRKTYQVGLDAGLTDPYPHLHTYVVSRSLATSPDERVTLVSGDVPAFVRTLKARPGRDIYLCGGADLAGQLLDEGLVDEIKVKLNPVLFGSGIPLVAPLRNHVALEFRGTRVYDSGVVLLTYRVVRGARAPAPVTARTAD